MAQVATLSKELAVQKDLTKQAEEGLLKEKAKEQKEAESSKALEAAMDQARRDHRLEVDKLKESLAHFES